MHGVYISPSCSCCQSTWVWSSLHMAVVGHHHVGTFNDTSFIINNLLHGKLIGKCLPNTSHFVSASLWQRFLRRMSTKQPFGIELGHWNKMAKQPGIYAEITCGRCKDMLEAARWCHDMEAFSTSLWRESTRINLLEPVIRYFDALFALGLIKLNN